MSQHLEVSTGTNGNLDVLAGYALRFWVAMLASSKAHVQEPPVPIEGAESSVDLQGSGLGTKGPKLEPAPRAISPER